MDRLLYNDLLSWMRAPRRKPVLVDGARQTGKTHLIEQIFGARQFRKVHKLDFNLAPGLASVFADGLAPRTIVDNIEVQFNEPVDLARDLIFFDEVGDCQPAVDYHRRQHRGAVQRARRSGTGPHLLRRGRRLPAGRGLGSVKRFRFKGVVARKRGYQDLRGPIDWLEKCRLAWKCYPVVSEPTPPLPHLTKESRFRLFFFDIGILRHLLRLA